MPRRIIFIMLTLCLSVWAASLALNTNARAHGDDDYAAGEPGDPSQPFRTVNISMREDGAKLSFVPAQLEVRKDEQIKFVLHNDGALDHEFVLATKEENDEHAEMMRKNPDMVHADPNQMRLAPKATEELLWKFTRPGEFEFACLIPGHREAGMKGTVIVAK
jgi:uncharacterized cupredoxin-like copper-binding protein